MIVTKYFSEVFKKGYYCEGKKRFHIGASIISIKRIWIPYKT